MYNTCECAHCIHVHTCILLCIIIYLVGEVHVFSSNLQGLYQHLLDFTVVTGGNLSDQTETQWTDRPHSSFDSYHL